MKPKIRVYLYSEPASTSLRTSQLADYVKNILPTLEVSARDSFIGFHLRKPTDEVLSELARRFAQAKVRNLTGQGEDFLPLPGEVDYERRRLGDPGKKSWGILYDGYKMMSLLQTLIPVSERNLSNIHTVFTNQLFGTWNESDRRYHARVSVYGFPSIISTTGIVEAPAKPREYYLLKQQYTALGMPDATAAALETRFQGRYIDHNDERLTEVMKGYVMQALMYHFLEEPFCQDTGCRLYNAHWQSEVIKAQLESEYEFCPFHQDKLRDIRESLE